MKQGLAGKGPGKTAGILEGHLELRAKKEGRLERTLLHPWAGGGSGERPGDRRKEALKVRAGLSV